MKAIFFYFLLVISSWPAIIICLPEVNRHEKKIRELFDELKNGDG